VGPDVQVRTDQKRRRSTQARHPDQQGRRTEGLRGGPARSSPAARSGVDHDGQAGVRVATPAGGHHSNGRGFSGHIPTRKDGQVEDEAVHSNDYPRSQFDRFLNLEPEKPRRFLFTCETPEDRKRLLKDLVGALRLVNPTFESRSIRRGALQHMARTGTPASVLMSFSGHGTVAMLKTCLGFGTLLEDEAKQQRAAAQRALAEGAIRSEVSCYRCGPPTVNLH
jgi:hypothetical protein